MVDALLIIPMAAWVIIAALACFGVYQVQRKRPPAATGRGEPTVLIIPMRGVPEHLGALWQGLCAQTHGPVRVMFTVESTADPAYAALNALTGGPPVEIVVAGPATRRGQKVHNLLAAIERLRPEDAVIVFADADIVPAADWLARLVRELDPRKLDLVSGYRWLAPADERWSTAFVCVINSSIAAAPRDRKWSLAWGGSMALRRHTLEALDLKTVWDRAVSDDLTLSRGIHALGGSVRSPRDALVQTPASYGWRDGIAFGRRQYLFMRMHAPWHWLAAAAATTLPLAGWAVALPLAITGDPVAIGVILAANALDYTRARLRQRIPRKLWGIEMPARVARLDRWGTPAWLALHAVVVWSTLFGRSVTWAGRIYRLDAQAQLERTARAS